MIVNVRFAALKALVKILEFEKTYEETFKAHLYQVENPSSLKQLLVGAIKFKLTLDFFIEKVSSKKLKKLSPTVRNILRLAIYEIEYMKTPEFAVVNSYVNLCKEQEKGSVGFINAILRNFIRKKETLMPEESELGAKKYLSIRYSHPEWLIDRWLKLYGREKTEKICEYNNNPPKTVLRLNSLRISKNDLISLLNNAGINFEESKYCNECLILKNSGNIQEIVGYKEGYWVVQGESSSMVARVIEPQEGELVLDLCAAPGGKTTHIAALMNDSGRIVAVDASSERLKKLENNLKRLGIKSIGMLTGDGTVMEFKEIFDRILIDAPCSNTGVLAARPEARWRKTPKDITNLVELQLGLLKNAAKYLKPEGIMVYSTCSIEPDENEFVIRKFLTENDNFMLQQFETTGNIKSQGMLQILQFEHDIDGFFIAKLKKIK